MKTNLLTVLLFLFSFVIYSCSKEDDSNNSNTSTGSITESQRRIIISNCSSHAGCHSSRINHGSTLQEVNVLFKNSASTDHPLSMCQRNRLNEWINGEAGN